MGKKFRNNPTFLDIYNMNTVSTSILLDLKQALEVLVSQGRITEQEMLDLLLKAGLAKLPEGEGWIDETGARYHHH